MNALLPPLIFPVEARFTVTEELADLTSALLNDAVMPRWIQIGLPIAMCMQLAVQLPKLQAGGHPWISLGFFVIVGGFYGLLWWRGHKKRKEARAAVIGKEVYVRFFEDGFDFGPTASGERISYVNVNRIARDNRGLVVISKFGPFVVPTIAFSSSDLRDVVFTMIGGTLKKK